MTGTWLGPGSAASNNSRTNHEKGIYKIVTFPAGKKTLLPSLCYCDLDMFVRYFWAPNLLESKFDCPGFFRPATKRYCHPLSECYLNITS